MAFQSNFYRHMPKALEICARVSQSASSAYFPNIMQAQAIASWEDFQNHELALSKADARFPSEKTKAN